MVRRQILWSCLFLAAGALVGVGFWSFWQQSPSSVPSTRIAIVDGQRLRQELRLHPDILAKYNAEGRNLADYVSKSRENLRKLTAQVRDPKLTRTKRAALKKQLQLETDREAKEVQKRQIEFRRKEELISEFTNETVFSVTGHIAKKHNINLILNSRANPTKPIMYAASQLDLTDEVIQEVNRRLAQISVLPGVND